MEIARLQFQLGQHSNAVEYAERAVKTFPNHRYVVRSFACLLSTIGESEKALYYLRKSESFRWDPWVQSAEVAISSSIKKSTKLSKARLQHIRSLRSADKNMTELAAGLATIETESGNRKTAKHLLELSMSSPNENSLAQLRWLQQNKNLAPLVQPNIFVDNASEANVYDSIKLENPTLAVAQAEIWQMDQPFLSQSALIGSSLCLSVLDEPSRALKIVDRALIAQPNDLSLHNNRFVGLVLNGQINEANDLFNERLKTKRLGEYEPFTYAALGLMAFAKGKCDDGRGFYLEAMKSASKNKNPDLVVTAFIYWIGREFSCKQISNSDAVQLIETLEKKLEKQNSVLKRNSMALATIRRRVSAANSSPPLAIASEIKKTADTSYNLLNAAVANETHGDV